MCLMNFHFARRSMRKSTLVIESVPIAPGQRQLDRTSPHHNVGDAFIEAIATEVALRLESMGLASQQRLMDVHDAARYLGMTANAIREKAAVGQLPCVRIDGKLRFDRRELDRWIDRAPRQGV
jgi:excisionase family DNA binding protein